MMHLSIVVMNGNLKMNKMTILVGNVGATKTSWAQGAMFFASSKDFPIIINQDKIGTRNKCLEQAEFYMIDNFDIIIDRTNINKKQREYFINLAKKYNYEIRCINFIADPDKSFERVKNRIDHPTIKNMSDEKIKKIIKKFGSEYEVPTMAEGFSSICTIYVDIVS